MLTVIAAHQKAAEMTASEKMAQNALDPEKDPNEVLSEVQGHALSRRVLSCFRDKEYLTCEPIDAYMALLQTRANKNGKKIMFLPTHFYNMITKPAFNLKGGLDYVQNPDPFEQDLVVIPIHQASEHWVMVAIETTAKEIRFYDPTNLVGGGKTEMANIARFFDELSAVKHKRGSRIAFSGWARGIAQSIPRQTDAFNCGVYLLFYAEYLGRKASLSPGSIDPKLLPAIRVNFLLDLLSGTV